MRTWISNLSDQRAEWVERGVDLAGRTRDRGVSALETVRSGTLDWRATLEARRVELDEAAPAWFRFTGLQLFLVHRAETALLGFGERVRAQIKRLSQLELAKAVDAEKAAEPVTAKAKKAGAKKAVAKKTVAKKTVAKKAVAKKAVAKKAVAKKTVAKKTVAKKTVAKKAVAKKAAAPAAKAPKRAAARASTRSRRFLMPIADYDRLNAKQAIAEIGALSASERETVAEHERAHKNRKTVLAALARKA